jgi:hypothetical protein
MIANGNLHEPESERVLPVLKLLSKVEFENRGQGLHEVL